MAEAADESIPRLEEPITGVVGHTASNQSNVYSDDPSFPEYEDKAHTSASNAKCTYVPLGKVDAYAKLASRRKYHMCPTEGRVWRPWQEKPCFMCTKPHFRGDHLMFPQKCYSKASLFEPPVSLKPSEPLKKSVEPHVCTCGRVCHGPEKDEQEQKAE